VRIIVHNCRTQHSNKTLLLIFRLILQTVIIVQMMSSGREEIQCASRVYVCVVSVEMVVNTKLEVQSIDNVVATIYGRKDSGLYASLSLSNKQCGFDG